MNELIDEKNNPKMTLESIILRYSSRGMNILAKHLPVDYCMVAAKALLQKKHGRVLLCTGFHCFDAGETDGPIGTLFLAKALREIGFCPVIMIDEYSVSYFDEETSFPQIVFVDSQNILYVPSNDCEDDRNFNFDAMIAVERCGRAEDGKYYNMKGIDISSHTPSVDDLFINNNSCLTIGIGDGGNEIGMGNCAEIIQKELLLNPSSVKTDYLIVSTVSNWGAYGLIAALSKLTGKNLLPKINDVEKYLCYIVDLGAVDGVKGPFNYSVDGFDINVEKEILEDITKLI